MDEAQEPKQEETPQAAEEPAPASQPQGEETAKAPEGKQEPRAAEEQAGEAKKEPGVPLDVYSLLNYSLALMRDFAWQAMGLVPNAGTGKIERNLNEAQIAIDTCAFLAEKLEPHMPEADRGHLRSMIRDLKINFVQQRSHE